MKAWIELKDILFTSRLLSASSATLALPNSRICYDFRGDVNVRGEWSLSSFSWLKFWVSLWIRIYFKWEINEGFSWHEMWKTEDRKKGPKISNPCEKNNNPNWMSLILSKKWGSRHKNNFKKYKLYFWDKNVVLVLIYLWDTNWKSRMRGHVFSTMHPYH